MKLIRTIFFGQFVLCLGGACAWFTMLHLVTALTATQISNAGFPFVGQKIIEWELDYSQQTDGIAAEDGAAKPWRVWSGGKVKSQGYKGPASFLCGAPIEQGYVTSTFDDPRDWGAHGGIDYGTHYRNLPVEAHMGGEVIFAGDGGPYGNLVAIENQGVVLYLGHLDSFDVAPGDVVTAGDVIGISGTTGNSTGIHVHVEFRAVGADGQTLIPFDPREQFAPGQAESCGWDEPWQEWVEPGTSN